MKLSQIRRRIELICRLCILIDWLIDWLIIYDFTSRSRIFHLYGDFTIACEGLQNLDHSLALRAFEQGRIFIVPHLLTQSLGFSSLIRRTAPFCRLLRHTRGCGGSILTRIRLCILKLFYLERLVWMGCILCRLEFDSFLYLWYDVFRIQTGLTPDIKTNMLLCFNFQKNYFNLQLILRI
jgi:hypothetical protein